MSPRRQTVDPSQGVLHVEWPLFGELSRALALKVTRTYDPEDDVGVPPAGVIPRAVVDPKHGKEFHSIVISRRYRSDGPRDTPAVFSAAPTDVRDRRVLIVDETCDSGETMRLAVAAIINAGATPCTHGASSGEARQSSRALSVAAYCEMNQCMPSRVRKKPSANVAYDSLRARKSVTG